MISHSVERGACLEICDLTGNLGILEPRSDLSWVVIFLVEQAL